MISHACGICDARPTERSLWHTVFGRKCRHIFPPLAISRKLENILIGGATPAGQVPSVLKLSPLDDEGGDAVKFAFWKMATNAGIRVWPHIHAVVLVSLPNGLTGVVGFLDPPVVASSTRGGWQVREIAAAVRAMQWPRVRHA